MGMGGAWLTVSAFPLLAAWTPVEGGVGRVGATGEAPPPPPPPLRTTRRNPTTACWERVGGDGDAAALPQHERVPPIRLSLLQRDMVGLEARLLRTSDPSRAGEEYGTHLSLDEVRRFTVADAGHVDAVRRWVRSHAAAGNRTVTARLSVTGDDLVVEDADARWVRNALGVSLYRFRARGGGGAGGGGGLELVRALECPLTIPSSLRDFVEVVQGICGLPDAVAPSSSQRWVSDEPGASITPAVLRHLYRIQSTPFGERTSGQSSQSVAEFEEAYFFPSDVEAFQEQFGLPLKPVAPVVGENDPSDGYLGEASLDTQYASAAAPGLPLWVLSHYAFDLSAWAEMIMNATDAPRTHSISWGSAEDKFDEALVRRWNGEFIKLGAMGHSILAASGDKGSQNSGWLRCRRLRVQFPASSPYVTAVGGTVVYDASAADARQGHCADDCETGWSSSGGGFSAVFDRPFYQDEAVSAYLSTYASRLPDPTHFNNKGRAIPDVAGVATNYQVIMQGVWGNVSGTSASAPVWAGLVAELNRRREEAGLPSMGFLNPWLYAQPRVGRDITSGSNRVWPCKAGFPATPGWDALTGLGTPDHAFLIQRLNTSLATQATRALK